LRFVLDGRVVAIDRPPATMTVLEYLRDVACRRGTKEGCAEGDCGACTVVVGELSTGPSQNPVTSGHSANRVTYRAVNSCIRFLPTLDGKELVTVESLQAPDGRPHPVQQSLIDRHASQCGFCTPGFVMSLFALYLNRTEADREQILGTLAGNLCRCTGYRPIIEAGMRQWDYPVPQRWSREEAQSASHVDALESIARKPAATARTKPTRASSIPDSLNHPGGSLNYPGSSLSSPGYHAPRTLAELAKALEAEPAPVMLAGGTDVGLWVTKDLRELPGIVYLGDVAELTRIERRPHELWIGAAVTLTDAWPALLVEFPELAEQGARFASPPIRNSATLCGNLANGSPIGDSIPAMIALGAQLELQSGAEVRRLPLDNFYLGYQKKDLRRGEFVAGVAIPPRTPEQLLASYKVSKRVDQDISAVSASFCVNVHAARVTGARLAFGGLAGIASRARRAESALIAQGWNTAGIEACIAALGEDFEPLSDLRAGAQYRLQAAGGLLRRFYLQHQGETSALRGETSPLRTADALLVLEAT
jgi:xanthine dehydrogenase small subunit